MNKVIKEGSYTRDIDENGKSVIKYDPAIYDASCLKSVRRSDLEDRINMYGETCVVDQYGYIRSTVSGKVWDPSGARVFESKKSGFYIEKIVPLINKLKSLLKRNAHRGR